jgi:hypothetical protein
VQAAFSDTPASTERFHRFRAQKQGTQRTSIDLQTRAISVGSLAENGTGRQLESDSNEPKVYGSTMRETLRWIEVLALFLVMLPTLGLQGDAPPSTTRLPELIQVLRTNLTLGSAEFEAQASQALIERFGVRPVLGGSTVGSTNSPAPELIARRERLDGGILYLRLGRVDLGLPTALRAALNDKAWTTNASGLVVDLRFTSGDSLPAAGETASLFSDRTEAILHWGSGSSSGSGAQRLWNLPMAVLVNNRTEGAAEALAAALRQETGSPLIGQATAGRHGVFREVGLGDGTRLQVPAGRIRLGDGVTLAAGPIPPDIRIPVPENTERGFLKNPTAALKSNGTNGITGANGSASLPRRKVTEADLVRAQRSEPTDSTTETHTTEKATAPIRLADPVLARAADLVRGLNAFQKAR